MNNENRFFYANSAEVSVSPYEISIKFIRQGAPESKPSKGRQEPQNVLPINIEDFVIAMSPSHAKALLPGLFNSVMQYEKNLGDIPLEAVAKKQFNDTFGPLLGK